MNYTPTGQSDNHVLAIGVGGGLGIVMLFNVWGIIWPNNKKIIRERWPDAAGECRHLGAAGVPGLADEFLLVRTAAVLYGRRVALLSTVIFGK